MGRNARAKKRAEKKAAEKAAASRRFERLMVEGPVGGWAPTRWTEADYERARRGLAYKAKQRRDPRNLKPGASGLERDRRHLKAIRRQMRAIEFQQDRAEEAERVKTRRALLEASVHGGNSSSEAKTLRRKVLDRFLARGSEQREREQALLKAQKRAADLAR